MKVVSSILVAFGWVAVGIAQVGPSAQQLFEAGQHELALQAIAQNRERGITDPADTYLAVQSWLKLGHVADAKSELARLMSVNESWRLVAQSASALIDGDTDRAVEAASRAAGETPQFFFASYQLGLVHAERQDWDAASAAFERASQIDPMFAYAHYYAGLSYSKIKRADRTAMHFEMFLKLAPRAPERPAVESIMRTLRGR